MQSLAVLVQGEAWLHVSSSLLCGSYVWEFAIFISLQCLRAKVSRKVWNSRRSVNSSNLV